MPTQLNQSPLARRDGLSVQELGREVLLFDSYNETAHALNGPAAFVWKHADGTQSVDAIARAMAREFDATADAQVVRYALDQLEKRQLLERTVPVPAEWHGMTRRQFLARVTAGAAVLAVITTIVVPSPVHAQSVACLPEGTPCQDVKIECCEPFVCVVGIGAICQPDHVDP